MHRCLYVYDILIHIFHFVDGLDDKFESYRERLSIVPVGKRTLATLARTCRLFNSPALDLLWLDLDDFYPLLKIFPTYRAPATRIGWRRVPMCLSKLFSSTLSFVDDPQWLIFRKYAKHVKTLHACEARVPMLLKQQFLSSLQHSPEDYLPLLPNLVKLQWAELSFAVPRDSELSLLRYFAGPLVTTLVLTLMRWPSHSPADLATLMDLPLFCPKVASFTIIPRFSWDYEPSQEVGEMVVRWQGLRALRACAIPQSVMDELLSRQTLESLHFDYHKSSPVYSGRIPYTVRDITLDGDSPSCLRFLETVHASPSRFRLLISRNEREDRASIEIFHHLPRCLDTSRLQSLTIQPISGFMVLFMWQNLRLRQQLLSAVVEFRALHELDLDCVCAAQMSNAEYESLALSLTNLRSLKLGTVDPFISLPRPIASVGAVIAVLRCCPYLETLHIAFDGSLPPPVGSAVEDGEVVYSEEQVCRGWGVSNRRITTLCVGYSPIEDSNVNVMASCLKLIMPCLAQIDHEAQDAEWRLVQDALKSY